MKIAVVGGGIFGVSAALELDRLGHEVTLFEKKSDILQAASGINQYRLHRGYHYPRSLDTITACLAAEPSFRQWYGESLINDIEHYYAVAKYNSRTSAEQFQNICDQNDLFYKVEDLGVINPETLQGSFRVEENLIDPFRLRDICHEKLAKSRINLCLNQEVVLKDLGNFDKVIIATYASLNQVMDREVGGMDCQFEVCEKLVLRLPEEFNNKSVVIVDGPFMCVDPFGTTGYHVMGNVVHAIHASNVGRAPIIPDIIKPLLNNGLIKNPPITNFNQFIESATAFMPLVKSAEHIGSMYTVRVVLPNVDDTDTRPTLVRHLDDKVSFIFSGKLINCVQAAQELGTYLTRPRI